MTSLVGQQWTDAAAKKEIRALQAGIRAFLTQDAVRERVSRETRTKLHEIDQDLSDELKHVEAVWS